MPTPPTPDGSWSIKDIAAEFSVAPRTVQRWVTAGLIVGQRHWQHNQHGKWLFDPAEVRRMVAEGFTERSEDTERVWPRGEPERSNPSSQLRGADRP